jgi:hypothetical protein
MEEELSLSLRFRVVDTAIFIRVDMEATEPDLPVFHSRVTAGQRSLPPPERFYLSPLENNPRLIGFEDSIVSPGFTISDQNLHKNILKTINLPAKGLSISGRELYSLKFEKILLLPTFDNFAGFNNIDIKFN